MCWPIISITVQLQILKRHLFFHEYCTIFAQIWMLQWRKMLLLLHRRISQRSFGH